MNTMPVQEAARAMTEGIQDILIVARRDFPLASQHIADMMKAYFNGDFPNVHRLRDDARQHLLDLTGAPGDPRRYRESLTDAWYKLYLEKHDISE